MWSIREERGHFESKIGKLGKRGFTQRRQRSLSEKKSWNILKSGIEELGNWENSLIPAN
jgi:hypothetical protein